MQIKVKGILSYPHLFQPRAVQQGDEPKYSVNVLIPAGDPQVAQIQQAIATEQQNGFPSGFPANGKTPLRESKDYPGYMELRTSAKADSKPPVVDMNLQPVMDPARAYAGAVAWVAINTYVYNQPVNKGIGAGVNGVMLTGEEGALGRIDGRPTVEAMFGEQAGGAPAPQQTAAAPAPAAAPAAAAVPPTPPTPPAAPAPQPQYQMTEKAAGLTREQYHQSGWTDEQLIQHGYMLAPGGVAPSFA